MLQVGGCVHFDFISTNKEKLTNTFPGYRRGYHNLFRKFVSLRCSSIPVSHLSWDHWNKPLKFWWLVGTWREKPFSSWNTSCCKEWMEKHRFIFLQTNKLLKNWHIFSCCCGHRLAASFMNCGIGELWNVRAKTSKFNQLWFALQ